MLVAHNDRKVAIDELPGMLPKPQKDFGSFCRDAGAL